MLTGCGSQQPPSLIASRTTPRSSRSKIRSAAQIAHIVIEKISGKLASRPRLDKLLAQLQPGDQVVVTRLRRIGRSHQHLLDLAA